jgi:DNA-binding transcriptional MerR regulator
LSTNAAKRLAFLFGRQSGIRSTGETLEQVQEQLQRERSQHTFDVAQFQEQISFLLRDNAELRLEIATRDREAAFAALPFPSGMMH